MHMGLIKWLESPFLPGLPADLFHPGPKLSPLVRYLSVDRAVGRETALFDEQSREILALAIQEAWRFNHECIDVAHVLLGCLRFSALWNEEFPLGALRRARAKVLEVLGEGPAWVTCGPMPATAAGIRIFRAATALAAGHGDPSVRPEHLWLALLQQPELEQRGLLAAVGINIERSVIAARTFIALRSREIIP
jgi:hypothetical protein